MVCIKSCLLATMLLTSMIVSSIAGIFIPIQNKLNLNDRQKIIYNDIVKNRLQIFLFGLIFGILIAYSFTSKLNLDRSGKICVFIIITIIVNTIIYTITPKKDWMLRHLNKEQIDKWLIVYNQMKIQKLVGLSKAFFFRLMNSF